MGRTLIATGGKPRMLAPTTTTKLARRMLCASQIVADHLPPGIAGSPALEILLLLYVAEEDANDLTVGELPLVESRSPAVRERWVAHLVQLGLVDRRHDLLALSAAGHQAVTEAIEMLFAAQRALD